MIPPPKRRPRALLLAHAGIAAVGFGTSLACSAGKTCNGVCGGAGGIGPLGTPVSTTATTGGSPTGRNPGPVQYCGIPDGGTAPCDALDGGIDGGQATDGGDGHSEPGDGG